MGTADIEVASSPARLEEHNGMDVDDERLHDTIATYSSSYARLFCHRRDAYALQTDEGAYYARRKPVTRQLIAAHLAGEVTAGWYALDRENRVRWAALDADGEDGLCLLQQVGLTLRERGWPSYLEESRRGGHLWIFFPWRGSAKERTEARPVRDVLLHLLAELEMEDQVELYPAQNELREGGLGSLVRGPLGVHRVSERRYQFLDLESLEPLATTLEGTLKTMAGFQAVTEAQVAGELARILEEKTRGRGPPHSPRRESSPSGGPIQELEEEIGDLHEFISRFVALDQRGRGHCPFHPPDRHPSFAVNREEGYWVDFHDGTGGDAIAFYQRMEGIGFPEAVRRLAQMYGRPDLIEKLEGRKHVTRDRTQVLSEDQLELLGKAEAGELLCSRCGDVLQGEFADLAGVFVGVVLSCRRCSFLENFSAPAKGWERRP